MAAAPAKKDGPVTPEATPQPTATPPTEVPAPPTVVNAVPQPPTTGRTEAIVTYDVFSWLEPKPGVPGKYDHYRAFQGYPVHLLPDALARGLAYGAVALPADAPTIRAKVESLAGPVSDDSELAKMSGPELIAYVTQNPDEAARVHGFEAANLARGHVMRASHPDGEAEVKAPQVSGVGTQAADQAVPTKS